MAETMMAFPDLRHPFAQQPIHPPGTATVLYQGRTITLSELGPSELGSGDSLLVKPEALSSINGYTVKPEGACYEDLCVPLNDTVLKQIDGQQWFDLVAFADLLGQVYVADSEASVWSFGDIPAHRDNTLVNAMAPDFEVQDRQGNVIRMADLKGKKALIVTWSSW